MGQGEMLKLLEKNPDKWYSPEEASKFNNGSIGNTLLALTKLKKEGWAYRRNKPLYNSKKRYIFKYRNLYEAYEKRKRKN